MTITIGRLLLIAGTIAAGVGLVLLFVAGVPLRVACDFGIGGALGIGLGVLLP